MDNLINDDNTQISANNPIDNMRFDDSDDEETPSHNTSNISNISNIPNISNISNISNIPNNEKIHQNPSHQLPNLSFIPSVLYGAIIGDMISNEFNKRTRDGDTNATNFYTKNISSVSRENSHEIFDEWFSQDKQYDITYLSEQMFITHKTLLTKGTIYIDKDAVKHSAKKVMEWYDRRGSKIMPPTDPEPTNFDSINVKYLSTERMLAFNLKKYIYEGLPNMSRSGAKMDTYSCSMVSRCNYLDNPIQLASLETSRFKMNFDNLAILRNIPCAFITQMPLACTTSEMLTRVAYSNPVNRAVAVGTTRMFCEIKEWCQNPKLNLFKTLPNNVIQTVLDFLPINERPIFMKTINPKQEPAYEKRLISNISTNIQQYSLIRLGLDVIGDILMNKLPVNILYAKIFTKYAAMTKFNAFVCVFIGAIMGAMKIPIPYTKALKYNDIISNMLKVNQLQTQTQSNTKNYAEPVDNVINDDTIDTTNSEPDITNTPDISSTQIQQQKNIFDDDEIEIVERPELDNDNFVRSQMHNPENFGDASDDMFIAIMAKQYNVEPTEITFTYEGRKRNYQINGKTFYSDFIPEKIV